MVGRPRRAQELAPSWLPAGLVLPQRAVRGPIRSEGGCRKLIMSLARDEHYWRAVATRFPRRKQ